MGVDKSDLRVLISRYCPNPPDSNVRALLIQANFDLTCREGDFVHPSARASVRSRKTDESTPAIYVKFLDIAGVVRVSGIIYQMVVYVVGLFELQDVATQVRDFLENFIGTKVSIDSSL